MHLRCHLPCCLHVLLVLASTPLQLMRGQAHFTRHGPHKTKMVCTYLASIRYSSAGRRPYDGRPVSAARVACGTRCGETAALGRAGCGRGCGRATEKSGEVVLNCVSKKSQPGHRQTLSQHCVTVCNGPLQVIDGLAVTVWSKARARVAISWYNRQMAYLTRS